MKIAEIASRILAHLKRFEADPEINKRQVDNCLLPYYCVNAWAGGRFVYVRYVSFQSKHGLTKEESIKYLAWLDAGNVGKHWSIPKDK